MSIHMMDTTTAQMRMGEASMLVSVSRMVWNASEFVMMAAKPQMAPTFRVMGIESTVAWQTICLTSLGFNHFQNRTMDSRQLKIKQRTICRLKKLKRTKRTKRGMRERKKGGFSDVSSI